LYLKLSRCQAQNCSKLNHWPIIVYDVCDDVIVLFSDFNYNGFYVNGDDSDDFKRAKGFNYHQGPVSEMSYVQYMVSQ